MQFSVKPEVQKAVKITEPVQMNVNTIKNK